MIEADATGWRLAGPLTIATATQALAEGEAHWPPSRGIIDLAGLTQVDSAALSVLLCWRRRASAQADSLRVQNMPPALHSLAVLYGVDEFVEPR